MAFIPFDMEDIPAESLIDKIFTKEQLKVLYYQACRIDIDDNNDKAEIVSEILGDEFDELGTGTNRIAFLYNPKRDREFRGGAGLVFEIALDRRGFVDNFTEFKRSAECPEYFVKVYECNMLISVQEYVTLMEKQEFLANEMGIKNILEDLSKNYVFEDIGFDLKNYENYGYRSNGDIVILDVGYIYTLKGNENILTCPKCRAGLKYTRHYTSFICTNNSCRSRYSFLDIRRRMNTQLEDFENQMISQLNNAALPDLDRLNEGVI